MSARFLQVMQWDITTSPADESSLLDRAERLAGWRLGELAMLLGEPAPESLARAKGWVGTLLERALGAQDVHVPSPDFGDLGVELKTLPIDARGKPRESTHICMVTCAEECLDLTFKDSRLWGKLQRILWIPVEADASIPVAERRIGRPILWSPTDAQEAILRSDWENHMEAIRDGFIDEITAHHGEYLQIRPKARDAKHRVWGWGECGDPLLTLPRGYYLRALFTEMILRGALESSKALSA